MTRSQSETLARIVEFADSYHEECEEAQYSDTGELWNIIKMFSGVAASILEDGS